MPEPRSVSDPLATSIETWQDGPDPVRIDPRLTAWRWSEQQGAAAKALARRAGAARDAPGPSRRALAEAVVGASPTRGDWAEAGGDVADQQVFAESSGAESSRAPAALREARLGRRLEPRRTAEPLQASTSLDDHPRPGSQRHRHPPQDDSGSAPDPTGGRSWPDLLPGSGWTSRLLDVRSRYRLRRERAEAFFAQSRSPERGLPVAEAGAVRGFMGELMHGRGALATALVVFNVLAAVAGLVIPRILGNLIDLATGGGAHLVNTLDQMALAVVAVIVVQAFLTFLARWSSARFGQGLLAAARERIVRTVLGLPLGKVESASTGDLVTRITRDVTAMSETVRWALPNLVTAGTTVVLTLLAMLLNSWVLALPSLATAALLAVAFSLYLRRAPQGYITEAGTYSAINSTMAETVEGARTVEALRLAEQRIEIGDDDVEESAQAERYTMTLRNLLFTVVDISYQTPLIAIVLLGTWGFANGLVTLGQITAATIYVQSLVDPMDRLLHVFDRIQVGIASTTRLLGIAAVPADRTAGDELPSGVEVVGRDLRFAYRAGHDVLHGIDVTLIPGERLAVVGPSGSGKSTLGRLLAGINGARTGDVRVGGVDVMALPVDLLRTEVALVTQEHHVFVGSLRDNVVLARDQELDPAAAQVRVAEALRAVDAWDWVERLPDGLDTQVGSGKLTLTPAQAQQVALARLIVADPHTLVLDEATSLIDPSTARHLEGSMHALLAGRTVVAIAHRLHTAHDAERIAVVIDGRIVELGSHDELLAADGEYAALWRAWTS